jgi:hypothetical protein
MAIACSKFSPQPIGRMTLFRFGIGSYVTRWTCGFHYRSVESSDNKEPNWTRRHAFEQSNHCRSGRCHNRTRKFKRLFAEGHLSNQIYRGTHIASPCCGRLIELKEMQQNMQIVGSRVILEGRFSSVGQSIICGIPPRLDFARNPEDLIDGSR